MALAQQVDVLWGGLRDNAGEPLNGGKVYTYAAGTTSPVALYDDETKTGNVTNPIILDSAGRADAWADGAYAFTIKDSSDVTLMTLDGLTYGVPSTSAIFGATTESSGIYSMVMSPSVSSYEDGQVFSFMNPTTNTGTATFGGAGMTKKPIITRGEALVGGEMPADTAMSLMYSSDADSFLILASDWQYQDYTPSLGAGGSMTFTSTSITYARYCVRGRQCHVMAQFSGTTGGSAGNAITMTLPVDSASNPFSCAARLSDGSAAAGIAQSAAGTPDYLNIYRYDFANWSLGADRSVIVNATYEIE